MVFVRLIICAALLTGCVAHRVDHERVICERGQRTLRALFLCWDDTTKRCPVGSREQREMARNMAHCPKSATRGLR